MANAFSCELEQTTFWRLQLAARAQDRAIASAPHEIKSTRRSHGTRQAARAE